MKIAIKRTDGGVSIMTVIGNANVNTCVEQWKAVNEGKYVSHREMPDEAIPTDRSNREAWADETPELVIDIRKPKGKKTK